MQKGFILSLIFATLVAVFALKNADKVLIDFLFGKVMVSQALIIFISTVAGALIVFILGFVKNIKLKKALKEANKTVEALQNEKEELSNLLESVNEREKEVTEIGKE
ncbi:LapA family protein [Sporanaerobacter sp. PP17-6a]|jgi:uncharacterized integral membrane protein|uniref:LapA family protein n=1 Tax=Sporanaerobacter sp. PP17-6a TaxID=1891289 RepID=UPI00089FD043|nr:LapA family protein [Sporanaerobacter sp. PP17-6a]SCL95673.1 putative integral membrane protein [Sporanaerobacter sp. PP17-6a]